VPINHPRIVLSHLNAISSPSLAFRAPSPGSTSADIPIPTPRTGGRRPHRPIRVERREDEVGCIEEVAHPRGTVRDEGEDLGDEGLLDQWWEGDKEFG
jgi:hypothetical protein